MRRAGDVLGPVTEEWRTRCNLPRDCMVLCGLHDSNAALLATRGYPEIGDRECTILSTGTWFVAMRALAAQTKIDPISLPEARDCLVNVDVSGTPVPSSRFMGGREMELLAPDGASQIDPRANKDLLVSIAGSMIREGVFALPGKVAQSQPTLGLLRVPCQEQFEHRRMLCSWKFGDPCVQFRIALAIGLYSLLVR